MVLLLLWLEMLVERLMLPPTRPSSALTSGVDRGGSRGVATEGRGAGGGLEGILTWAGGGGGVGVVTTGVGVGVVTLRLFMLRSCGSSSDPVRHNNKSVNIGLD